MNVALIIERFETWRGGQETSTMLFATHLARQGCAVHILTTTQMPSTPDFNVIPIKASKKFRSARTLAFANRAADYARSHSYNIVHSITPCLAADVYQPRGGLMPEILERNAAIRTSAIQRNFKKLGQQLNLKYRTVADLENRLLTRQPPPFVIAISDYVQRQLQKHFHFDPDRIVPIFNGVDPDLTTEQERWDDRLRVRRQYHLSQEEPVALCVAHNFKLKGVGKLIEAIADPQTGDCKLLIVGRDDPGPYVELSRRLGVRERVLFTGPTQRIDPFFHAADLLVHPTYYDPCSRVVLEALSSGLPVITTRFNGAAERIEDGRQGFVLASPLEVARMAECIGQLLDRERRQAMSAQAITAVDGISMAEHARKVFKLYEHIVQGNRNP